VNRGRATAEKRADSWAWESPALPSSKCTRRTAGGCSSVFYSASFSSFRTPLTAVPDHALPRGGVIHRLCPVRTTVLSGWSWTTCRSPSRVMPRDPHDGPQGAGPAHQRDAVLRLSHLGASGPPRSSGGSSAPRRRASPPARARSPCRGAATGCGSVAAIGLTRPDAGPCVSRACRCPP
jgi:hypothetical protein